MHRTKICRERKYKKTKYMNKTKICTCWPYIQGENMNKATIWWQMTKLWIKTTKCQDEIILTVQDYHIYSSYIFKPTICKERKYVNKKSKKGTTLCKDTQYVDIYNKKRGTIFNERQYMHEPTTICTNQHYNVQIDNIIYKPAMIRKSK